MAVVEGLRDSRHHHFASVEAAFLELAEPSVAQALAKLATKGARQIVVMPYFLAAGAHVTRDIPEMLAEFRNHHPEIHLTMKAHIGSAKGIGQLILDMAAT